jgi:hypothetical protein
MADITINIVFGPERPNAARKAVEAVRVCKERLAAVGWPEGAEYDRLLRALRAAECVRAQYCEYGDSLYGALDGAGGNRGQSFATLSDVRRHVEGTS